MSARLRDGRVLFTSSAAVTTAPKRLFPRAFYGKGFGTAKFLVPAGPAARGRAPDLRFKSL